MLKKSLYIFLSLLFLACSNDNNAPDIVPDPDPDEPISFGPAQAVSVIGYEGNLMEPFLSRDGSILFFNNLNSLPENTNLHWALKIDDTSFDYQGELEGVNTEDLEGVATLDNANNLFFVYTGEYETSLATIFKGRFSDGTVTGKEVVENLSLNQPGWVNFDVEVSANGNSLYVVDGRYDENGGPYEANIFLAIRNGTSFQRATNSAEILQNINTEHLEYAAAISSDELELYFTRILVPYGPDPDSQILIAKRSSTSEPFGEPQRISELSGFVEAPTLTPDNSAFYYHKKVSGKYVLLYRERQ